MTDVEDYYVFPEVDYILQQKNDFKPNWIGVKNVTDKSVKGDRWPGDVGWYVATLGDGKESEHARLSGKKSLVVCSGIDILCGMYCKY